MSIKTVIINLDRAKDRLAFQKLQFSKLGLEFEKLSADCPTHQENYERFKDSWERPMSFCEIAVFFNHKKAWEMVEARGEPMMILEDDAYLSTDVLTLLDNISRLDHIDFLSLEARGKNQRKLVARQPTTKIDDVNITRLYQGRSGLAGYILWPLGAKKLLKAVQSGKIGIVDKFINAEYSLNAYQVEPAPLIQLDRCQHYGLPCPLHTTSYISSQGKKHVKGIAALRFKCRRIAGQVKILVNEIMNRHRAVKRPINISGSFN